MYGCITWNFGVQKSRHQHDFLNFTGPLVQGLRSIDTSHLQKHCIQFYTEDSISEMGRHKVGDSTVPVFIVVLLFQSHLSFINKSSSEKASALRKQFEDFLRQLQNRTTGSQDLDQFFQAANNVSSSESGARSEFTLFQFLNSYSVCLSNCPIGFIFIF